MKREKRSILVVDSSATFTFYIAMLLKKFQYDVQTAATAKEALEKIATMAPAVVITDTVLPSVNGVELLKQIKKTSSISFIPVIMHTAEANPAIKDACTGAGCAYYFIKPVQPDVLYRAIQAATEATPRQNIRINTSLNARVGAGQGRFEQVTSLSEAGLYINSSVPEPLNAVVPLRLFIKTREIPVNAVVLYSSAKVGGPHSARGMGMKFTTIEPEDVAFIRQYIREQVMNDVTGKSG